MEFQVLSVCLEDRYPRGVASGVRRQDLRDILEVLGESVVVEKEREGCIAFVFGRAADGRSVCVRVEDVHPKLYFEVEGGNDTHPSTSLFPLFSSSAPTSFLPANEMAARSKLEAEVGGCVGVRTCHFAHDYGYEFDERSPSGRRVHTYIEASYSSLTHWRAAVRLRKQERRKEIRKKEGRKERRRKYER